MDENNSTIFTVEGRECEACVPPNYPCGVYIRAEGHRARILLNGVIPKINVISKLTENGMKEYTRFITLSGAIGSRTYADIEPDRWISLKNMKEVPGWPESGGMKTKTFMTADLA